MKHIKLFEDFLNESNEMRGFAAWEYDPKTDKAKKIKTGTMAEVGIEGFSFARPDSNGVISGAFELSATQKDVEEEGRRKTGKTK